MSTEKNANHKVQLNQAIIEFYDKLSSWEHSVVRDKGFSLAQVHTLEVLGCHGAMRMKELADKLGITMGTLTVQVDKLAAADLIQRRPHQTDGRSIVVELTEAGQKIYQEHDELHLSLTQDITSKLTTTQIEQLVTCIEAMNAEF